ncbi:hypothetical protein ACFC4G_46785 [Streptomyces sp. NPDC056002]|uniref:hypothetical protein n=1 Tax=Streptomyces sp. NPDC056002 TaxID=3345675 RepID=UPI0035D741C1
MTTLLQTLFNGLAVGSVYALIALVHKASHVVNFAHGSLLLLGGYLVTVLHEDLGFVGAVAVAAAGTAAAAMLEALVLRRLRQSGSAVPTILTIGVDILLLTELARRIGGDVLRSGDPWGAEVVTFAGITVPQTRIACLVVTLLLVERIAADPLSRITA